MATIRRKPQRPRLWTAPRRKIPIIPSPPSFAVTQRGPTSVNVAALVNPDRAPDTFPGSDPEWWVYRWLIARGFREGIDFSYQVNVGGGRRLLFGNVVDFLVRPNAATFAWRVMGYYWHLARGYEVIVQDFNGRLRLERDGFSVVDIWDVAIEDPQARDEVLEYALDGIEWSILYLPGPPPTPILTTR